MTQPATIIDEAEMKKMLEALKRYYDSSVSIGKDKIDELHNYMNQGVTNIDFTPLYDSFDYIKTQVKEISDEFKNWLGGGDFEKIMSVAVKSFGEFSSLFADNDSGSASFLKNMTEIADLFVANKAMKLFDGISSVLGKLQPLHDRIMRSTLDGMETQSDFIRNIPIGETESTAERIRYNVKDIADLYKRQTNDLRGNFLISADAAKSFASALSNSELDLRTLEQLSMNVENGEKTLYGLSAAYALARGSGIDFGNSAKLISTILKETGGDQEDVTEAFGLLKDAQNRTSLSSNTVARSIMDGADSFKYFGNNVKQVTSIYNSLIKTLGSGKEGLAADIFRDITSNLASMEDGMKSFLAMSAGYGSSPLAASLRFEEALASGDGLGEILGAMKEEIVRLSGTPLMTRAEAVAGGDETSNQYQILKKVVSQITGIDGRDSGKIDYVIKMLQGGDFEKVTKESASDLFNNSKMIQDAGTGAIDTMQNAISLFTDTIAQEFSPRIEALNTSISSLTQFLAANSNEAVAPSEFLSSFFANAPEKIAEKIYQYASENPNKLQELPQKIQEILNKADATPDQIKAELVNFFQNINEGNSESNQVQKLAQVLSASGEVDRLGTNRIAQNLGAGVALDKGVGEMNSAQILNLSTLFEKGISLTPQTIDALASALQRNITLTVNGNNVPVTGNTIPIR